MKQYKKTIDGKTVVKKKNGIVVRTNGKQVINPSEELLKEDGWEEYNSTQPTQEEITKQQEVFNAKRSLQESDYKVLKCIEAYLCGEDMPYDIKELHKERNKHREKINKVKI